ncbi:hypothetical protein [Rhizobium sp. RCC_161_2]|uniref:hypothetical protein n=1 Tax=Rhizobium sp. RCC_161_2 TaxID=3239219 RepID=UPI0035269AF2
MALLQAHVIPRQAAGFRNAGGRLEHEPSGGSRLWHIKALCGLVEDIEPCLVPGGAHCPRFLEALHADLLQALGVRRMIDDRAHRRDDLAVPCCRRGIRIDGFSRAPDNRPRDILDPPFFEVI